METFYKIVIEIGSRTTYLEGDQNYKHNVEQQRTEPDTYYLVLQTLATLKSREIIDTHIFISEVNRYFL